MEYTPSAEMVADGLTKVLQSGVFEAFREQLGLKDLTMVIEARKRKELDEEALDEIQEAIEDLSLRARPSQGWTRRPRGASARRRQTSGVQESPLL